MTTISEAAVFYHECFLSFVNAGFTEDQALELTKNQQMINAQYAMVAQWSEKHD